MESDKTNKQSLTEMLIKGKTPTIEEIIKSHIDFKDPAELRVNVGTKGSCSSGWIPVVIKKVDYNSKKFNSQNDSTMIGFEKVYAEFYIPSVTHLTTQKRIAAGDTVYELSILNSVYLQTEIFVLERKMLGRGIDKQFSGKIINSEFKFDSSLENEVLALFEQEGIIHVKGKTNILANKVGELLFHNV